MKLSRQESGDYRRWLVVVIFAIAMAWVEAAVVYDLRTMFDRLQPYQPRPLPIAGDVERVEIVREVATMVMLLSVGILAGRTWRSRLGYGAVAFGVWDCSYYLFLKAICGWPHSLLDWDVLFLVPLPWWGPVLAPMSVALLMVVWGTLASVFDRQSGPLFKWRPWALNGLGTLLALYVFMADALRMVARGSDEWRTVLPTRFNWPLFAVAFVLMAAPIIDIVRRMWLQGQRDVSVRAPASSCST